MERLPIEDLLSYLITMLREASSLQNGLLLKCGFGAAQVYFTLKVPLTAKSHFVL